MERGRKNHSASSAPPRFHFLQTLSQKATPNNHRLPIAPKLFAISSKSQIPIFVLEFGCLLSESESK